MEHQMDSKSTGLLIAAAGVFVVVVGLLVMTGALSWFGRLPGDIRIERDNARVYIPITSMILVSIVLSAITLVLGRLLR